MQLPQEARLSVAASSAKEQAAKQQRQLWIMHFVGCDTNCLIWTVTCEDRRRAKIVQ